MAFNKVWKLDTLFFTPDNESGENFMSDNKDQTTKLPPPSGDPTKAEKYIQQLIPLISQNKVTVIHTDLSLFDPTNLEDHYRVDLSDYQVEVSHSKNPDTSEDSYVILFNNLKQVREGCSEKSILAYMHLTASQFLQFKKTADEQVKRIKKAEEEKRFTEAMSPIDEVLNTMSSGGNIHNQTISTVPTDNHSMDDIHSHSMKEDTTWPAPIPETITPKEDDSFDSWQAEETTPKEIEHPMVQTTEISPATDSNNFDSLSTISEHMNRFPLTEKKEISPEVTDTENKNINSPVF